SAQQLSPPGRRRAKLRSGCQIMLRTTRLSRTPARRVCLMLVSVPWAHGCLPPQEESRYSEGSASGAGGEQPAPSESEPGDPPPGDDSNEGLPSGESIPTPFTPDERAADGGGGATATASSDTGGVDAGTAVDAGAPVA